jgi:hypothetical protein
MIYGIIKSQNVKLSKIGEAFEEGSYHGNIKRLSRNLASKNFLEEILWKRHLEIVSQQLTSRSVISLDLGDLTKEYAEELEGLDYVRDGDKKKVAKGYPVVSIEGINPDYKHVSLYLDLFSRLDINYKSDNAMIYEAVHKVSPYIPKGALWVVDRGFDNEAFFDELMEDNQEFVSRQRGDRHLIFRGKEMSVSKITATVPKPYRLKMTTYKRGKTYKYDVKIGWVKVKIPGKRGIFYLIVAHNPKRKKPLMLLTNRKLVFKFEAIWCVKSFFLRWGIEEGFRLVKVAFGLEDFRVQCLKRIRRLMMLAWWAWGFVCEVAIVRKSILKNLLSKAWAPKKQVRFIYYRLCDVIKGIFSSIGRKTKWIILMQYG